MKGSPKEKHFTVGDMVKGEEVSCVCSTLLCCGQCKREAVVFIMSQLNSVFSSFIIWMNFPSITGTLLKSIAVIFRIEALSVVEL